MERPLNLPSLGSSLKVLFTSYLLVTGVGMGMAFAQLQLTHGKADGKPGLSVHDVVYSYYGNREGSLLEAKLEGSMKEMAPVDVRSRIVRWVREGSSQAEWEAEMAGVFAAHCVRCHGTIPGLPDFTDYAVVKERAAIDEGKTIGALARVSHVHLFGIGFIYFFVGGIFSLATGLPRWLKGTLIALPFAFLLADIGGWWATKWVPSAAWLTILGGAGAQLAGTLMVAISLVQMWWLPRGGRRFEQQPWWDER